MTFGKLVFATIIFAAISLTGQISMAQDKTYKFDARGYSSKKVTDEGDFVLLSAAEYTLKKGYIYFVLTDSRKYEKTSNSRTGRFGRAKSKKGKPRTEINISVYKENPDTENALNANDVKEEIKAKYSE